MGRLTPWATVVDDTDFIDIPRLIFHYHLFLPRPPFTFNCSLPVPYNFFIIQSLFLFVFSSPRTCLQHSLSSSFFPPSLSSLTSFFQSLARSLSPSVYVPSCPFPFLFNSSTSPSPSSCPTIFYTRFSVLFRPTSLSTFHLLPLSAIASLLPCNLSLSTHSILPPLNSVSPFHPFIPNFFTPPSSLFPPAQYLSPLSPPAYSFDSLHHFPSETSSLTSFQLSLA